MRQLFIEDNEGADQSGRLLHVQDAGSTIELEGAQIWRNFAEYLLSSDGSGAFNSGFVSTARNSFLVIGTTFSDSFGAVGPVFVGASILHDIAGNGSGSVGRCVSAENFGLMTGVHLVSGVDPQFVAAGNGDLSLTPSSNAIDFCDTSAFIPNETDLALVMRGIDHPFVPDQPLGPYDLGAWEFDATAIFADGFESGNTSAWSSTSP